MFVGHNFVRLSIFNITSGWSRNCVGILFAATKTTCLNIFTKTTKSFPEKLWVWAVLIKNAKLRAKKLASWKIEKHCFRQKSFVNTRPETKHQASFGHTNSKKKERWSIFHFSRNNSLSFLRCSDEKKQLRRRRTKRLTSRWRRNYYFQVKIIRHLVSIWLVHRKT